MNYSKILEDKCKKTIAANHIESSVGQLFVAGGNQFRTLWTRDFCYSVPGLLAAGYSDTVERQLKTIFGFKNEQNLLPRGIDVINPKTRVLKNTAFKFLASSELNNYKRPLIPEYLGEHRTPAFDSNILFLLSVAALAKYRKQDIIFSGDQLQPLLNYYDAFFESDLLVQPEYSDWQDSARRTGSLLLTHLLYLKVLQEAKTLKISVSADKVHALQALIMLRFFSNGLFREQPELEQFSIDSHCLLIQCPELLPTIKSNELYLSIKTSPLWRQAKIPGIPVWPRHADSNVSWTTKIVGLRHYHDGFHWGWLIAEAAKAAKIQGDNEEYERIVAFFTDATENDEYLSEIYLCQNNHFTPFKGLLYKSESPFTWSAAKWLETLSIS